MGRVTLVSVATKTNDDCDKHFEASASVQSGREQSWCEESARFHFLKRLPTKLVPSECRTGRDTPVKRGAIRSFSFPYCFRNKKIDVSGVARRKTALLSLEHRGSCSIKGQVSAAIELSRRNITP